MEMIVISITDASVEEHRADYIGTINVQKVRTLTVRMRKLIVWMRKLIVRMRKLIVRMGKLI